MINNDSTDWQWQLIGVVTQIRVPCCRVPTSKQEEEHACARAATCGYASKLIKVVTKRNGRPVKNLHPPRSASNRKYVT